MSYVLKMQRRYYLICVLILCYLTSCATSKVIVKANILRGERFVTARTSASEIETKVIEVLKKKGFEITTSFESNGEVLLVDLFVYQFPAQYPAITLTIRTHRGIHYIDQEYDKVFVDRELTNINMASKIAERVPLELNRDYIYRIGITNLITANKASNGILFTSDVKYYSTIRWKDDNGVPFIVPNDLALYLFYASNFTGLKKQLANGPIVLKLRINNSARFELVEMKLQGNLDETQKNRIRDFIESFPLWATNAEVEDIEILYGQK